MEHFTKEYIKYWKNRVESNSDGSKVADNNIIQYYLKHLNINKTDKILDLGCGHGRLYDSLSKFSKNIYGTDISYEAINEASKYPYIALIKGKAEDTNFASASFNKVIAWGVFDVVEQEFGFKEVNRILKNEGIFLVTGKNNNYCYDDNKAFIAERNAKLKEFPNHFTDVSGFIKKSEQFGFKVLKAFAFKYRGNFGDNNFIPLTTQNSDSQYYEFLLFLQKTSEPNKVIDFQVCDEFSITAKVKAKENNFKEIIEYFKWHKQNYDE